MRPACRHPRQSCARVRKRRWRPCAQCLGAEAQAKVAATWSSSRSSDRWGTGWSGSAIPTSRSASWARSTRFGPCSTCNGSSIMAGATSACLSPTDARSERSSVVCPTATGGPTCREADRHSRSICRWSGRGLRCGLRRPLVRTMRAWISCRRATAPFLSWK